MYLSAPLVPGRPGDHPTSPTSRDLYEVVPVIDPGFVEWYRDAHPRLIAALVVFTGSTELAADSVDEACARALAHWSRVRDMDRPDGWAYRVAINHAKRRLRRASMEHRLRIGPEPGGELPAPAIEAWEVVRRLPPRQRAVVVLRYLADLPEQEIAVILGIRRGTVASTLSDARRALTRLLTDDPEERIHG